MNSNIENLKKIKTQIEKLSNYQKNEIFKIITSNNNKYTSNINGIFINMNKFDSKTLVEIQNFLNFSNENNKELDTYEKYIENLQQN
jgi:hypothetical protein